MIKNNRYNLINNIRLENLTAKPLSLRTKGARGTERKNHEVFFPIFAFHPLGRDWKKLINI